MYAIRSYYEYVQQPGHAAGGAGADGVAEGNFVTAHVEQGAGHLQYGLRLDLALVGTAQYAGDVAAHRDVLGLGGCHYRLEAGDALGDAAVDVFL